MESSVVGKARVLFVLALFVCSSAGYAADSVKVGVIAPFSGEFGRWGEQFERAITAFQAINGDSVNGRKVEIILRDDGGLDPARAKRLAEELIIQNKVDFLAGFAFTPNALSVASVIDEARIPTILFNAAASNITRASAYFVRASYTVPQAALPVAQWARERGYNTVVTLVAEYSPGLDAEDTFTKVFSEAGGKVIEAIRVPVSATDFAPYFERISVLKPDAVFLFGPGGPSSVGMVRTWAARLKNQGIQLIVTTETPDLDLPNFGRDALGIIGSSPYLLTTDNPVNKRLRETLAELYGPEGLPDVSLVAAYDGMQLIYDAIALSDGTLDGAEIIQTLRGRTIDSPRGQITIDAETGDIVQDIHLVEVMDVEGRLQNVSFKIYEDIKDPWKEWNPE